MDDSSQDKKPEGSGPADATRPLESEPDAPASLRGTGQPGVEPAKMTSDELPDPAKSLATQLYKWLRSRLGERWAYVVFVTAAIVVYFAIPHLSHLESLGTYIISGISEHLPLPQADPNTFTVAIVHLDNDESRQIERDIVEGLREVKGIDVRDFNRPAISDSDVKAGHELAHKYLEESGAQVLIWGKVITAPGKSVPKLYWTVSGNTRTAKESGRYPLTEDLSLPPIFVSDLANVLRLLVVTQSVGFSTQEGHFVADQLTPFIQDVQRLLGATEVQGWSAEDVAQVRFVLADALVTFGEQSGKTEPLQEAVATYYAALQQYTRERVPLDWAMTQNNLGSALRNLGEREHDSNKLCDALQAHINAWQVMGAAPHYAAMALAGARGGRRDAH